MKSIKFICLLTSILFSFYNPIYPDNSNDLSTVIEDKNPLKILTPSLKDVKTKKLVLSNGIKVFLISDDQAKKSSASLAVSVGSWNDPAEFPGMAHFCEHMLFMGSEKYPDENAFSQFIQDSGGMTNAYTKSDRTNYMFSINHEHLDKSLDMFSRFFIDPKFSQNSIARELLAVNQEHLKNIENDSWRSWFIFKKEGNQDHPNAMFNTGSEETLKIITRDDLSQWYNSTYKSNKMHLVIYSNKTLDTLTMLVENVFSHIPTPTENLPIHQYSPITSERQLGHMTYVEPIMDIRELSISWEIPKVYANDLERKPCNLIGFSLCHHMKGGLYACLKKEGLIDNLHYSVSNISTDHQLFTISFSLTKDGIQKKDHVLHTFFQALNKLKNTNIPIHIFSDIQGVLTTNYQWQSRPSDPFHLTSNLADQMINEDLSTFPYKTYMISKFDPKINRELLSFLSPENAVYELIGNSSETHRVATKSEPWTGAKYSISKINEDLISAWSSASKDCKISVPKPNPFISQDQTLLTEKIEDEIKQPTCIAEDVDGICYLWQDKNFLVPRTLISIQIKSPIINDSAKSLCLSSLFTSFLKSNMVSLLSEGSFSGIHTTFDNDNLSLQISVQGYQDKLSSFMMSCLSNITSCQPEQLEFQQIKNQALSNIKSAKSSSPYIQGFDQLKSIISNGSLNCDDLEKTIDTITFEEFLNFKNSIFKENYIKVMISGNTDKESAELHFSEIKNIFSSKKYPKQNHYVKQYINPHKTNQSPKKIVKNTDMAGNATILLIDHGPFNYKTSASLYIFNKMIKESFFDELRTKQQTGYIAGSNIIVNNDRLLQYFVVQSTTHYPEELLARFELFLENYSNSITSTIDNDRFCSVKKSVIYDFSSKPKNFESYAHKISDIAFNKNAEFEEISKIITELKNLTYQEFITLSRKSISRENGKRLAVLVNGKKVNNKCFDYETIVTD